VHQAEITIGSKDFTEEILLGEMYAQLLEHHGLTVRRRLGLGGTQVAMAALLRGSIDLYPEYTGTAWLSILRGGKRDPHGDLSQAVARAYRQRFDLEWLAVAPMNDTQALAVTQELAQHLQIRTLSDLAKQAPQLRLGAVPEFLDRADGLPGLRSAYGGYQFAHVYLLDSGLKYRALNAHQVDVVVAFGTDGALAHDKLLVLRDDRHFWPEYHVAPVVRRATLQRFPQIASVLNPLATTLTDDAVRSLNEQVDIEKRDIALVASEHLHKYGLLSAAT
jgi:osmoprotectant transport system substrate-binding protein